ncbi:YggS family pyridoxal phosphate-dependent enzyme [Chitinophaga sp. GCM10012297]|uniref:Pyridoxal phosphate homeostasis protein n=1 Tax=Chitinophaga chungangae TaxID=2821488 RepID=A0ABS3Y9T3_9BACT|nr:YggS family pyridoxal phosphate-dependent enzyme [Chitinophaga chungangae]MBO9151391.1 YggS family pyridoxal phosphate-dependent enzyme [Chitinophaga chungangae]
MAVNFNNYRQVLQQLEPYKAKLVAVSKTKPVEDIRDLYAEGQRIFGENYVQELVDKAGQLPQDVQWHFIGHLQSNKVKYIAPFVGMIHGVDSLKLLAEISKQALKHHRVIDCLLQVHIATEETKFGLSETELFQLLEQAGSLAGVRIAGLMGMASNTDDETQVRREFAGLKTLHNAVKEKYFPGDEFFKELSTGMSGDYKIALEEGSTLVRIGSLLFGARNYA